MRVRLRQLKNKNGTIALRLDTFLGYYTDASGQRKARRIRETLPIHIAPEEAKETRVRQSILQQAEKIRSEKERELKETGLYPFFEKRKSHTSLLAYFQAYVNQHVETESNIPLWKGLEKRLLSLCTKDTQLKDINDAFCEQLLSSLANGDSNAQLKPLSANTVRNYYGKFFKVLQQAHKEGYLNRLPAVKKKINYTTASKIYLTEEEVIRLSMAFCTNEDLKKAFLFAIETGLHFNEIQPLQWKHINQKETSWSLTLPSRAKINDTEILLSKEAMSLLGETGPAPKLVFPRLKSTQENNIQLLKWAVKAHLGKQLTFTVSRNTFAHLSITKNATIESINLGLGHKDLRTTQQFITKLQLTLPETPLIENSKQQKKQVHWTTKNGVLPRAVRIQLRNFNHVFATP